MTPAETRFAIAAREELWSRGTLLESRLSHGVARAAGGTIEASDERDEQLVAACTARLDELRKTLTDSQVRLVASAQRDGGVMSVEATIVVTQRGRSIVTTLEHFDRDLALLRDACDGDVVVAYRELPIVWRNGSAAVLLHEAVGHAAEQGHTGGGWPDWLHVDAPLTLRRESFRDVPLPRMTNLVASLSSSVPPNASPRNSEELRGTEEPRLEVHLVDHGAYEPLDQSITLSISAADLVEGARRVALAPFVIHESRDAVARSFIGGEGEPLRYPGVICSREGQELVVGSFAPLLVTKFA